MPSPVRWSRTLGPASGSPLRPQGPRLLSDTFQTLSVTCSTPRRGKEEAGRGGRERLPPAMPRLHAVTLPRAEPRGPAPAAPPPRAGRETAPGSGHTAVSTRRRSLHHRGADQRRGSEGATDHRPVPRPPRPRRGSRGRLASLARAPLTPGHGPPCEVRLLSAGVSAFHLPSAPSSAPSFPEDSRDPDTPGARARRLRAHVGVRVTAAVGRDRLPQARLSPPQNEEICASRSWTLRA